MPEQIDVDEEINYIPGGSWESSINPALLKVFEVAQQVRTKDIDIVDPIPVDDYNGTVSWTREIAIDFRKRMENNTGVHERLLELSEELEKLERVLTCCRWPINVREEEDRFRCLGQLGIASIGFQNSLNKTYVRL